MRVGLGVGLPMPSGVGVARFSPLDLDPVLWLDASAESSITESGGAVSQWDDLSGNGNDVVQATAAAQPTTGTTTINGLNVLAVDGSDLLLSSSLSFTGLTMCAVFQHSSENFMLLGSEISGRYAGAGENASASTLLQLAFGTIAMRFNGSAFTGTTRDDLYQALASSTKVVTLEATASVTTAVAPYAFFTSAFRPVGAIAEVIIVDGSLSAGELSATESYLAQKWGITL